MMGVPVGNLSGFSPNADPQRRCWRCPHCATKGAVIRGRSNGLRRYCCKGCGRIFNALTFTPLARLCKKELWAAFAAGLSDGDTVKGAAE